MAYRDFKNSPRRTASDKAFNIAKNPKYDGYQRALLLWFMNFLIKSCQAMVSKMRICQTKN